MTATPAPATPPVAPVPVTADLYDTLREFVGLDAGPPRQAPDPVNQPIIRHFVEAMGDDNPIYGRDGVVAPAPRAASGSACRVEVEWVRLDDEFTLPRFGAAGEA